MKKLVIYGNRLAEIKTINNDEYKAEKNVERKNLDNKTKLESNSLARTMKYYKELLYANACDYTDTGVVLFVTALNNENKEIDHSEYERRLKLFLQRVRRKINGEKHMLVKEYGFRVGYHFHMFVWADSISKEDVFKLWEFGSVKIEPVESLADLARLGNYCFNYSTKYNPWSEPKIQRKMKGLKHFSIHESLVKKSSGLTPPVEITVDEFFELPDEYSQLSHSERMLSPEVLWTSTFFEKDADNSNWTRYNADYERSSREEDALSTA